MTVLVAVAVAVPALDSSSNRTVQQQIMAVRMHIVLLRVLCVAATPVAVTMAVPVTVAVPGTPVCIPGCEKSSQAVVDDHKDHDAH